MSKTAIARLRGKIDRLDKGILNCLNRRAEVVLKVGRLKARQSEEFYTPSREKILIDRLKKRNKGPFPSHALQTVYREIISASRALNAPMTVAYLGPEATFTHMAALKHFGRSCEMIPVISISRVFEEVEGNRAHCGVVGIENSTEGVVGATLDRFQDSPLKIIAEITLPITHNLLSRSGTARGIRKLFSHPQALGQCRAWLEEHFPNTVLVETESTSQAAARAAEEPNTGAIASDEAALTYRLKIVHRHIEDNPNNITRFVVLGRKSSGRTGHDKTSILFSVKDEVGILFQMLKPFYEKGINLTKIESHPLRKKVWEYIFFLDMDGHIEEKKIAGAIRELGRHCLFVKVLGSYPKATS
ncbi:MAG: prephenate dehydratase [Deltaproteobacteria bacterium]|nr:prephenate dehydratase [Deltaproteobacteria bacterium]